MAKQSERHPLTLEQSQDALLAKMRKKECNGQAALGIAQWLAGTILGGDGRDPGGEGGERRTLGAPVPEE